MSYAGWMGLILASVSIGLTGSAASASTPTPAVPTGSPGEWVTAGDYPAPAMAFGMTGVTGFRLTIDPAGQPGRCEITQSSGFDVLDQAACNLIMQRARFTPATDANGHPAEGSYANRVLWVLPQGANAFSEGEVVARLSIDRAGGVQTCTVVAGTQAIPDSACLLFRALPAPAGLVMRGDLAEPVAQVDVEMSNGYGQAPPERLVSPRAGVVQRALAVFNFTLEPSLKLAACRMSEQRGDIRLVANFCGNAPAMTFKPPVGQLTADGTASGWSVWRVLAHGAPEPRPRAAP